MKIVVRYDRNIRYGNAYPCDDYSVTITHEPNRIAIAVRFEDPWYSVGSRPTHVPELNKKLPAVSGGDIELSLEGARRLGKALLEAVGAREGERISFHVGRTPEA